MSRYETENYRCVCVTFELWDLSGGTLGQPLVAGVARQSHRHAAAAQQEADLLAASVLHRPCYRSHQQHESAVH